MDRALHRRGILDCMVCGTKESEQQPTTPITRVLDRCRSYRPCPVARRPARLRRTGAALSVARARVPGALDAWRCAFGRRPGAGDVFEGLAEIAYVSRQ